MPSSKILAAMTRKKVTASARVKTSPCKHCKTRTVDQSGSYLKTRIVSSMPAPSQATVSSEASNNDAILAMLHKLDDSNKMLAQRLDRVEQRSFYSTPLGQGPHAENFQRGDLQTSPQAVLNHQPTTRSSSAMVRDLLGHQHHAVEAADHLGSVHQGQEMTRDAVLSTMDNLRRIPSVAEAVNDVLASYEARAKADSLQGREI